MTEQRDVFRDGEADAWFERNPLSSEERPSARPHDARIAALVDPSSSVLEVGCSDGRMLAAIADLVPGRFAGVDPSAAAITEGQRRWPHLELHVGTADALPFDEQFDVVILGHFLCWCDRELLPKIVAETDRVLRDGGTLAVVDFDPRYPRRRPYRHREGMWSYKMDYASLFAAFPSYALAEKIPFHHADEPGWTSDETERIALSILKKDLTAGYSDEADDVG